MEVHYRAMGGRVVVKVEGVGMKDVFKEIGNIAEILDADAACGKCGSHNIYPSCRSVKSFDYYSLTCSDCGAALSFGQRKDGGLWAKRKDEHGNQLDHRGWKVYLAIAAPAEGPRRASQAATPKDDPELEKAVQAIMRAKGDAIDDILAEVFADLQQARGNGAASEAWKVALTKFGDPVNKTGAAVPVLRHLWNALHAG